MEEFLRQMLEEMKTMKSDQANILDKLLSIENRTMSSFSHIDQEMDKLHQKLDAVCEQTADLLEFKTEAVKKIRIMDNKRLKTVSKMPLLCRSTS